MKKHRNIRRAITPPLFFGRGGERASAWVESGAARAVRDVAGASGASGAGTRMGEGGVEGGQEQGQATGMSGPRFPKKLKTPK